MPITEGVRIKIESTSLLPSVMSLYAHLLLSFLLIIFTQEEFQKPPVDRVKTIHFAICSWIKLSFVLTASMANDTVWFWALTFFTAILLYIFSIARRSCRRPPAPCAPRCCWVAAALGSAAFWARGQCLRAQWLLLGRQRTESTEVFLNSGACFPCLASTCRAVASFVLELPSDPCARPAPAGREVARIPSAPLLAAVLWLLPPAGAPRVQARRSGRGAAPRCPPAAGTRGAGRGAAGAAAEWPHGGDAGCWRRPYRFRLSSLPFQRIPNSRSNSAAASR